MPSKSVIATRIGRKMVLGPYYGKVSPKDMAIIQAKYGDLTKKIAETLPRYSIAVGAVIGKCALRYGHEKALAFCDTIANEKFNGRSDPAYLLWSFLLNCKGSKNMTEEIYKKSVTAVRAWCEDRTLTEIRAAKKDVFEWDKEFSVPEKYPGYREAKPASIQHPGFERIPPIGRTPQLKQCACGGDPIALFKGEYYCGKCYKKNFVAL